MSSPICKNQRRINAAVIACRPTWKIRIDSAQFRHHRFPIGSIGEPSSTVAPLNLEFRVLSSVLTHISCVAVRAVSFGASASFGNARLSVRPPVLFAFGCDRLVPKGVRRSGAPRESILRLPSLGITSAGISLASSSVCFLAVTPTGTCPDDHYLIVIADDPLVISDAILAIVVILWGRFATPVHPT